MKTRLIAVFVLVITGLGGFAQSPEGKEIFTANCKACHSIGSGDVVGPDLEGIAERRDPEWIKNFILNSQKMVAEGDEQAVEVFNKYHKIAMPGHNFSGEELNSLLSYMEEAGQEAKTAAQEVPAKEAPDNMDTKIAEANTEGPGMYFHILLTVLGISAILLAVTAAYLFRLLKA